MEEFRSLGQDDGKIVCARGRRNVNSKLGEKRKRRSAMTRIEKQLYRIVPSRGLKTGHSFGEPPC